jgi:hypothetical protein
LFVGLAPALILQLAAIESHAPNGRPIESVRQRLAVNFAKLPDLLLGPGNPVGAGALLLSQSDNL